MSDAPPTSEPPWPSARDNWLAQLRAARVFRMVASAAGDEGVPVLPVKGLITSRTLYPDVAVRPIRDVDVRVRRRDFARVVRIGRQRGWHKKHVVLIGQVLWEVDGVEVDVKSALGPPGLCSLSVDDVMGRAETRVDGLGFPHLEPEWNDHALMLVLNVFKDGLSSARWAVEDLLRIAGASRFDPAVLVKRAREGAVSTALWLVADWLARTENASAWRDVRDRIGSTAPSRRVATTYALWRGVHAPLQLGHFVVPALNDDPWGSLAGVGQACAGLARGYALRVLERVPSHVQSDRRSGGRTTS
jgi:hypothetical protein